MSLLMNRAGEVHRNSCGVPRLPYDAMGGRSEEQAPPTCSHYQSLPRFKQNSICSRVSSDSVCMCVCVCVCVCVRKRERERERERE